MATRKFENVKFIGMNGALVKFHDATIHPLNTAMKFGASVFDAWRSYWNPEHENLYVFRLREHLERLLQSAAISQIECPYTVDQLIEQTLELLRANGLREDLHCRLMLFVDELDGGLYSTSPVSTVIATLPMNKYFKVGADGVNCCVSSWRRQSDDVLPPRVKAAANYPSSRLAAFEARANGYDAAIFLDRNGRVSEGLAYSIFIVRDSKVITPPVTSSILESVTRDSFIKLCPEVLGYPVIEREIDRTELYVAQEAFFCGSSAEATPILSVDKRPIGNSKPGPITEQLLKVYMDVVRGNSTLRRDWRIPVYEAAMSE